MKRLLLFTLCGALAAASTATAGAVWLHRALEAPMPLPPEGALVRVPSGSSLRQTATALEEAGVLRSRWLLIGLARWRGSERELRAGEYLFTGAPTPADVLARLRSATRSARRITLPEGLTAHEVFARFEAAGFGGADVFACIADDAEWLLRQELPATGVEGYLFPDTYDFGVETPPEEILAAMIARHRSQFAPLRAELDPRGLSEEAAVTLASLIEKETGNGAERPMIAAVFHNRLRRGMPLQSDPTAVYERLEPKDLPIRRSDLLGDSDYNTYRHPGLPPGPIANPGLASLQAAVRPADVEFLYFVSRNDGTHEFSRTLDEHNRAVQRFQRPARDA